MAAAECYCLPRERGWAIIKNGDPNRSGRVVYVRRITSRPYAFLVHVDPFADHGRNFCIGTPSFFNNQLQME